MKLLLVALSSAMISSASIVSGAAAQTPSFTGRSSHALAYDSSSGLTYLFGGVSEVAGDPYPSSLWSWNGSVWNRVAETGPPGREDAALTFDAHRGRLVLHGGRARNGDAMKFYTDTWEWDGARWLVRDTIGPGPLVHAVMTFDPTRQRAILFGGGNPRTDALNTRLWEWDGAHWSNRHTVLGDALGVNDIFYSPARRTLLAHTFRAEKTEGLLSSDVWALRDTIWTRLGAGPSFSPLAPAALHQATGTMIVYAGFEPPPHTAPVTWLDGGGKWTRSEGESPPRRRGAAMVYDTRRARVVLIGGDDGDRLLHDVWEWDGARWFAIAP